MSTNYQVLARKYRPQCFADLVGQQAMVQTLSNAIKTNRLAHAFLLTGIRGVGKTTTARIIAKTINCTNLILTDTSLSHCGACANCLAYATGSHTDIIEMDAASNTGVNDIREIIENASYLPQLAAFKIYIIDEVHMLSTNAFNALLKTIEEPPKHVKFIFATTEIKKVPLTILSRCQKFALKNITQSDLTQSLLNIAHKENIPLTAEAATCIAKNSQGSLREALSMLDQAIALSFNQEINYEIVRQMLGISDELNIFTLLDYILCGKIKEALAYFKQLYEEGIDPINLIAQLFELVHELNKEKIIADTSNPQLHDLAAKLDLAYLTTIWQILSKGLAELKLTNHVFSTTEMIIIRLGYTAILPSVLSLAKREEATNQQEGPSSFAQILDLCKMKKELLLHHELMEEVKLINFQPGIIELSLKTNTLKDLIPRLKDFLAKHTNTSWQIIVNTQTQDTPTLRQEEDQQLLKLKTQAKSLPLVNLALDKFVGSTIISVKEQ